jgi:hypothetical protein
VEYIVDPVLLLRVIVPLPLFLISIALPLPNNVTETAGSVHVDVDPVKT